MLSPALLFVAASIIAVIGILSSFKNMMFQVQKTLEEQGLNMKLIQKEQTRFFLKVAMSEAVPIILIVYGFTLISQMEGPVNTLFSMILIVGVFIFALIQIFNTRRDILGFHEVTAETKTLLNTMTYIGTSMVAAIPLISVFALFTMMG